MVGMKRWLKSIDLDNNLKENELPDLIIPTTKKIEMTSRVKLKETENSWRMTMSKLLNSKFFAMTVMMLIVLVGSNCKVSAATVNELMGRDNSDYMLGAYTADKMTTYEAKLVTKVIFANKVPAGATDHWDVSAKKDGSIMSHIVPSALSSDGIQYYDQYIVSSNPINATNCYQLFRGYSNMTEIKNMGYMTTVGATSMWGMFYDCSRITTLDLSSFDTTNVTSLNKLFKSSQSLETLVLGPNFTKLDGEEMFDGVTRLKCIISNRKIITPSELMAFSASTGLKTLKSAILYVPSEEIETLYQTNSVYAEQLGNTRIEPMLALVGDNPQVMDMGGTYVELGFNIAGETLSNLKTKGIGDYKVTINTDAINNSILDTYDVVYTLEYKNPTDTNDTYTTYMSIIRKVQVDLIGPKVERFVVRNAESGTYAANTVLEIVATMSEEFLTTKGTIPEVSIAFGNGTAVKLPAGIVNGRNIIYTYTIGTSDYGKLECVGFDGELYDSQDVGTIFEGPLEFTDKEIYARSGVLLESDLEANRYFPTLKDAAHYITTSATLTMLLDEEAVESAVFKANTVVSLNINGKKIVLNTNDKSANTLISNKGILNITDSGSGTLGVVSTSGDAYIIANEGIFSIVKGSVRIQGSQNGTVYGVYNSGDLLMTGGNIDVTNPEGTSYGVYNLGTLRIEDGTIASATIKGTTVGVYNLNGSVNLLGGQIASRLTEGNSGLATAVYNVSGPFIVGTDDGSISIEKPVIYSTKDGLRNTNEGTLEFYDGVIEGEAYRALYTDKVKTIEGYALVRKLVGERERVSMSFDISKPRIELTNMTPNWTNGKVTIQAKFIDQESGIKNAMYKNTELQLVNNMVMIDVSENGIYTFKTLDFAGNTSEASIEISNIDKEKPTFENLSWTALVSKNEVTVTVTLKDNSSGVKGYKLSKYEVEPLTWEKLDNILTETTLDISLSTNGKYYLYAVDRAGNIGKYDSVLEITGIDITPPTITHLKIDNNGKDFINSSVVMINVEAKDDIGVEKILLSNTVLTNNQVINSKNWVPYSKEILWTFPVGDGEKVVYVWVKDAVGKISKASSATTKLLAQYIGNDGINSTTFKILSTDENYNYLKELTASDLYIRVKNTSGVETYKGGYGEGITLGPTPEVYGPVQVGSTVRNGRYYFIKAENIQGNGTIFLGLKNTAEVDKAQNQIRANKLEIETDVTIELNKPIISITETAITVTDADRHAMDAIRIGGKTVRLSNGSITRADITNKYGIELTTGTIIEAIDRCGNIARKTI